MTRSDILMSIVASGMTLFAFYSALRPQFIIDHWMPARILHDRAGVKAVRIMFALLTVLLAFIAYGITTNANNKTLPIGDDQEVSQISSDAACKLGWCLQYNV